MVWWIDVKCQHTKSKVVSFMPTEKPVLIVIGTRPEGIKMIPVYVALKEAGIAVLLCSTDQHTDLLQEVFTVFGVEPDIRLSLGRDGQDLFYITEVVLHECRRLYSEVRPSLVLVEGDTTTVMAAALAAFYCNIAVGHIEAGLRTFDIRKPFPEELNRRIVGLISHYHFTPTALPTGNLLAEKVDPLSIMCVGNTVVDALRIMQEKIKRKKMVIREDIRRFVETCKNQKRRLVLLTAHRRESFNGGITKVLRIVKDLALTHKQVSFVYPFHPNPNVLRAIKESGIEDCKDILLTKPVSYSDLVYLLSMSDFVMTDSGGIQEEAVSLGKSVMVLREKTERIEGVWAGLASLVGTDERKIVREFSRLFNDLTHGCSSEKTDLYGDGYAAQKIARVIANDYEVLSKSKIDMQQIEKKIPKSGILLSR